MVDHKESGLTLRGVVFRVGVGGHSTLKGVARGHSLSLKNRSTD